LAVVGVGVGASEVTDASGSGAGSEADKAGTFATRGRDGDHRTTQSIRIDEGVVVGTVVAGFARESVWSLADASGCDSLDFTTRRVSEGPTRSLQCHVIPR
jgi:hypothetical protein